MMRRPRCITDSMESAMTDISQIPSLAVGDQRARVSFGQRVIAVLHLRRQRRALRELDPHQLADIGLSADQAMAEARRPIWDVPPTWRL
jgi:uncharacterized protein YjiS (DUF1127 family)